MLFGNQSALNASVDGETRGFDSNQHSENSNSGSQSGFFFMDDEAESKSLTPLTYSQHGQAHEDNRAADCQMCLKGRREVDCLPCHHKFCQSCLSIVQFDGLSRKTRLECPVCHVVLSSYQKIENGGDSPSWSDSSSPLLSWNPSTSLFLLSGLPRNVLLALLKGLAMSDPEKLKMVIERILISDPDVGDHLPQLRELHHSLPNHSGDAKSTPLLQFTNSPEASFLPVVDTGSNYDQPRSIAIKPHDIGNNGRTENGSGYTSKPYYPNRADESIDVKGLYENLSPKSKHSVPFKAGSYPETSHLQGYSKKNRYTGKNRGRRSLAPPVATTPMESISKEYLRNYRLHREEHKRSEAMIEKTLNDSSVYIDLDGKWIYFCRVCERTFSSATMFCEHFEAGDHKQDLDKYIRGGKVRTVVWEAPKFPENKPRDEDTESEDGWVKQYKKTSPRVFPRSPMDMAQYYKDGVVFGCITASFEETMRRMLFGLRLSFMAVVRSISKHTALFLFNHSTKDIMGLFQAVGPGGENIIADAWVETYHPRNSSGKKEEDYDGSPLGAQVQVQCVHNFPKIHECKELDDVLYVKPDTRTFSVKLKQEQTQKLIQLFLRSEADMNM